MQIVAQAATSSEALELFRHHLLDVTLMDLRKVVEKDSRVCGWTGCGTCSVDWKNSNCSLGGGPVYTPTVRNPNGNSG